MRVASRRESIIGILAFQRSFENLHAPEPSQIMKARTIQASNTPEEKK
jgi:hypothetical protein